MLFIGSGIMCALGIREVNDIDLIVSRKVYENLKKSNSWTVKQYEKGFPYLQKGVYEVGLDWDSDNSEPNLAELKKDQVVINEIPFVSPDKLLSWKQKMNRPKDNGDIVALKSYLSL